MKKASKPLKLIGVALFILLAGTILVFGLHAFSKTATSELTLADLKFIHIDMAIAEISAKLGPPHSKAIYMDEYQIAGNRKVILRIDGSERVKGIWILNQDGSRSDFFTEELLPKVTLDQFDFLRRYMLYDEVIRLVGEPDLETGSGVHIAQYNLVDGRIVSLMLGPQQMGSDWAEVILDAWVGSKDNRLTNLLK
jgi:hypothetical protein